MLPASKQQHNSPALNLYSSFYELGGDLIGLASLTAFLEGEGFEVRLEDMIKRPTLGEQVALLSMRKDAESVGRLSTSTRPSVDVETVVQSEQRGGAATRVSLQKRAGRGMLNRSLRIARRVGAGRARDV